ncbi:MAG: hypothetical protein K9G69_06540 [Candidatus Nanopelagicales bacterium]|nr:hypothetical protein [Candidatus Nanopelagicales bacterium]
MVRNKNQSDSFEVSPYGPRDQVADATRIFSGDVLRHRKRGAYLGFEEATTRPKALDRDIGRGIPGDSLRL